MKKNISFLFILSFLLSVLGVRSIAQIPDTWAQKGDFGGSARFAAVSFSIGAKGYLGTGYSSNAFLKDFWEYDPSSDTWSQKADFGGSARMYASGFSIDNKGYVGCGNNGSRTNDFWEYDPLTNSWLQKANFGGLSRDGAVGFSIGSKGYIGTGLISSTTSINDFWEYDPASDSWTQKSNVGGPNRAYATGFSIGNKGYIGTGNTGSLVKDFWEFDPLIDTWTRKADFGGVGRFQPVGLSIGSFGYIGLGDIGGGYSNDFWEYNPTLDSWAQKATFGGAVRTLPTGFSIGNRGFVGTGFDVINGIIYKDFWEYTPTCMPPAITSQPDDQLLVYGTSASFAVIATDAVSYQWQEDSGYGFANITDGGIYSNSSTANLTISLPDVSMSGNKYRCIVTGGCLPTAISDGNATLTLNAKPIVITPDASQTKIYGYVDPSPFSYSYAPSLIGTDSITGTMSRVAGENAGDYIYALGTLTAGPNYNLSVDVIPAFSIVPKSLTVTAENKSKCFDGAIYSNGYTVIINGFVNGEDQSILGGTLVFNGTAISALNPGSYTIIPSGFASVNYAFDYVSGILNIEISPAPVITGPNSLCAGNSVVQYTTEPGFNNYVWTISYGGIITDGLNTNQVSVNWGTAGSRTIAVNYENSLGCSSSTQTTFDVTVLSVPVPIISGDVSVCSAASGIVYSTQENYDNYIWNISAGGSITAGADTYSITVNWTGSGNQTVSVDYTNNLGCQSLSPTVFDVFVTPKPASAGQLIGPNTVCAGSDGISYSVTPIVDASYYEWTLPTGASLVSGAGTSSITVDFASNASSGFFNVHGVNDCGTGANSPDFNVKVNQIPVTPVITQFGDTLFSSAEIGNQWYLDGLEIAGATDKEYQAVYLGTYTVIVTVNGCSSDPSNPILVQPVSIHKANKTVLFDIYPNPSNGNFNIKFVSAGNEVYTIEIYNSLGAIQWSQDDLKIDGTNSTIIDMTGVPAGVYTVVLKNKTNSMIKKAFITR